MRAITTVGLDADDTLWQNETLFRTTRARFAALLADHADPDHLNERLAAAELRNLAQYGYGVKGFTLSMIETAVEVTGGGVPGTVIADILAAGRDMLASPVELLSGAEAAVAALAGRYRLVLITKGDLIHQETKLAQSGLGDLFHAVEIVSEKTPATYAAAFARHGDGAARALMVGNSIRSDVLPALVAGGWAAHVPHALTWTHEQADLPEGHPRFRALPDLAALPSLVEAIAAG